MTVSSGYIPISRLDQGMKVADACVHYGFCTAVCPTYVLDGEENESPRGRIGLIKTMLASGKRPDPATVTHIDRCLSCLSCASTCAAGVEYRTLIDTAREYVEQSGVRPWPERLWRAGLSRMLTSPRLLRVMLRLGRPAGKATARLPGRFGALGRMAKAPGLDAVAHRPAALAQIDQPTATRTVALLEGCVQSALGPEINQAARRIFARLGIGVADAPGALAGACCGALDLHMGQRERARRQAARWVMHWSELMAQGVIDRIVVTTSGCGSVIKHYPELFDDDDDLARRARQVAQACVDASEFLADADLPRQDAHLGARVAYHDSCSLKHGQNVTRQPRAVLRRLGFKVLDVPESHLCCGSAGTYNLLQPAIADRLGARKAANIAGLGADVMAAANLGCIVQISRFLGTPVAHWIQLVDWAGGGPAPLGLAGHVPLRPEPEEPEAGPPAAETSGAGADTAPDSNSFW
ncbi:MAG TPA: glycolate oxidase subunit GlcF [Bordetella sp.]